ncbi:synaptotagmin-like protein 2 isoform X4 [Chiloscyllium plagiosum]|uniref:synaptotagmin-like protein 2 isoform X4 n=1 Tax=Chiloscyllium plagiosum TaxID=36176 RepID=UPI001CB86D08|nr:synaptotagmin-like protein 2 isoform X4 [Chiloscyllium plagiosum]
MKGVMDNHLDLSFLTEDEYQALLKVIQRDSELKKKDSERIRTAQKSIQDEKRRKLVTGVWFEEVKAKRYRNSLLGVDLIKASIGKKKPIIHDAAQKTESQQAQLSSYLIPTSSQTARYEESSDSTDGASEESPDEDEAITAKRKTKVKDIQKKSLYDPWPIGNEEASCTGFAVQTQEKGQQNNSVGPKVSTPKSVPIVDWQKRAKSIDIHYPQTYQSPTGSDISTEIQMKHTYSVSRIPRRIHSMDISGDLRGTGEPRNSNDMTLEQGHISDMVSLTGPQRAPAGFSAESPVFEQAEDTMKQDNDADSSCDTKQTNQTSDIRGQRTASPEGNTQTPRQHSRLEFTGEAWNAAKESEHSNVNGQGLTTVSTIASPVSEKPLDVPKSRKSLATHCKGASTYQVPEISDKEKMHISNITQFPKWDSTSRESETQTSKKPESFASESGPRGLPFAKTNEDQQAYNTLEKLNLSPTSQIPRLKIALETAGETRKIPAEDLKPLSRQLAGTTYGLSPVMKALARAKRNNAKSMDNLNSTVDRETITTSVNENDVKRDADDKPPAVNIPTLEHSRVKELSKSVPMLMTESESDSASEVSFNIGWHRKTPSDASHSSDMASVSSVSGSIMSVYSGDFGSIDAQGSVQFALDYNEKNKEFQIYVSQCKDLAVVDEKKGRTDAYVKTYLLPDKARMGKRKTSVKRRNINPLYNEVLKYKIEKSVLLIQKLNLSVWHNDTLGRNSFLGEVNVDLASWDWSNRELNWYLLKSRCPAMGVGVDHRGEINLAIKYIPPGTLGAGDPPTGEVHIWMKNAKDLPQLRSSGVDSFVKCYVLPDTSKKSYQKTRIVKKDTNPIYNHTIVYDGFRTEDLKEACVELTVWDHEKLTNHFLGGLRLGFGTGYSYGIPVEWMDSTEEEIALWQDMVSNPNEWIPGSLLLRSQLGGKKLK